MTHPDLEDLVAQARRDRPSPGALAALARSLRVPFMAAPAAAIVVPSSATAGVVAAKAGLSRLALWGWGAGSTVAVTGAVLGVALTRPAPPPAPPPAPAAVAAVEPRPRELPPQAAESSVEPQVSATQETEPRLVREQPAAVWNEPQLIERARRALATEPRRALMLTQEHQRRFPAGALGVEREVIAIEALARIGQTAEAKRRGVAFVSRYPSSIHLPRVRALLARLDAQ